MSAPSPQAASLSARVKGRIDELQAELIAVRRDLHAHPELSWQEERTTTAIAKQFADQGVEVRPLGDTGLIVDLGQPSQSFPAVALRADLDALPVEDSTDDQWASTVPGVAHACGHDVHTSALLGAGLGLLALGDDLPGPVRLIFQPAEEIMPGGALRAIAAGAVEDVSNIFCLHCDPGIDVGMVGLREGPLTGAADSLEVRLAGRGGHTSRPHLTEDLTFALGKLVTELPAVLSRRLDPRAGVSVVWGLVQAGATMNVVPSKGRAAGTVRMLDAVAWADAETLVRDTVEELMAPYGVTADVTYIRGVPPVVNEHESTRRLGRAIDATVGEEHHVPTPQSLGGEDFAWYLEHAPGAMARLGTRTPGGRTYDLHQGDLRIDERAVGIGAKVLAGAALEAIWARDSSAS